MGHKQMPIDYLVFARTISGHKRFYIRFLYNGKLFLAIKRKCTDSNEEIRNLRKMLNS